jgi:hypothetical protein
LEIPAKALAGLYATNTAPRFLSSKMLLFHDDKGSRFHYNLPKDSSLKDEPNDRQVWSCEFRARPMERGG